MTDNPPPPPPPPEPSQPGQMPPSAPGTPPPSIGMPGAPGGYGQPGNRYSIGEAFNYGWTKFQQNVGAIILGALAILGVVILFGIIQFAILGGIGSIAGDSDSGFFAGLVIFALFGAIALLLLLIVQAGIIRVSLDITYGRQVEVKRIFSTDQIGQIVIAALILAVMTGIGFVLCYIPGLIVAFFTQFTFPFLIDKQLPAVEAIKRSAGLVNKNLGTLIGFYIATVIAYVVGALLCGIGLLVAAPVVMIATVYTYRVLQGETVAP